MKITKISILTDNYIWIIKNHEKKCIIFDPGLAFPVLKHIKKYQLIPIAILITHHHSDHIDGVKELLKNYPKIDVYSSKNNKKFHINHFVKNNDIIKLLNYKFHVISTPGHTNNHISYYSPPNLFCGDTLFSGSCGKIQEGLTLKMYNSLKKLSNLPNTTLIFSSHEYTKSNLKFARYILPKNNNILKYYKKVKILIQKKNCTLPSLLSIEKKINPFLMLNNNDLKKSLKLAKTNKNFEYILSKLRIMKNNFK